MKKIFLITFITFTAFTAFIPVLAVDTGLDTTANQAGLHNPDITQIIGNIVRVILGLLGIFFIILMIYGGFMRMTAQGDSGKISKSTGIITSAAIGVLIILASYAITAFVLSRIGASTNLDAYEGGPIENIETSNYVPPLQEGDTSNDYYEPAGTPSPNPDFYSEPEMP